MWCEMVAALTASAAFRAQQGKGSEADAISLTMLYRRGSARALAIAANCRSGRRDGRSAACFRREGSVGGWGLIMQEI